MRKYFLRRIKMFIQAIVVIAIAFVFPKAVNDTSIFTVAMNTSATKVLDKDVITSSQNRLYENGLYDPIYTFVGELTGYAGDCPLCSGYLACPPRTNVLKEGIYYKDKTYGTVRIAASSKNYPCGTIIRFNVNKISSEPIIAIILDRGVGGNDIDLLTENEEYAIKSVGRVRNTTFEVLRRGWKNE